MVKRALVSVSDKAGLVPFCQTLAQQGVEILSTGGTLRALEQAKIPVVSVEAYTGSPEVMGGRVKTLHPRVHGGILMRGEIDLADLERLGGKPIDLVVVNLYPFQQTIARGCTFEEAIENIDIGGPSMLRSAAKNAARVLAVCDPRDYPRVLEAMTAGQDLAGLRRELAAKVFAQTASYDVAIATYLANQSGQAQPSTWVAAAELRYPLRYGENPHQAGGFYVSLGAGEGTVAKGESVGAGGKEFSFNNLVDLDAALEAVREFAEPAAVVVKHANPCGVSSAKFLDEAYLQAREADALSAFGGIVALNRPVDAKTAALIAETFIEAVVAPSFMPEALERLRQKDKLRLLAVGPLPSATDTGRIVKAVSGGWVSHDRDATADGEVRRGKVVTKRVPTLEEVESLEFAWKVAKHVKSNAIVMATGTTTLGVGAGQMSRLESVHIASRKAGARAQGAVLASDAFFPFPDGVLLAADAGIVAIAQPGGSIKDAEIIAAADARGVAMIMTGVRHFRHG